MAAQLALSAGSPRLYDIVKEADKKRVSPGSEALKRLFDACGSCLILMDELVAYAKRIYGVNGLPAGSFDNFISFIQEITEAARASKSSLVVASIPESDIEVGGKLVKPHWKPLNILLAAWKPSGSPWLPVKVLKWYVAGFFWIAKILPHAKWCAVISALCTGKIQQIFLWKSEKWSTGTACWPVIPYTRKYLTVCMKTGPRWSVFQRTRGVLRLMAAVIHELWMGSDAGLLIMPGSLPLDVSAVRDELTRHLPEGWNSLVDREVDGKRSVPWQQDKMFFVTAKFWPQGE